MAQVDQHDLQLLRAFGTATGRSVMHYVRARRLTEAARALAAGAPDIPSVAVDARSRLRRHQCSRAGGTRLTGIAARSP